jgi:hypothetical protein
VKAVQRRAPVSLLQQAIHTYLFNKSEEKRIKAEIGKVYKPGERAEDFAIVQGIKKHGEVDPETGSVTWEFDEPMLINGERIKGLVWQCAPGQEIDEDLAQELAWQTGVVEQVRSVTFTIHNATNEQLDRIRSSLSMLLPDSGADVEEGEEWNYSGLYLANQKKQITDDELDSVLAPTESWSLRVMK